MLLSLQFLLAKAPELHFSLVLLCRLHLKRGMYDFPYLTVRLRRDRVFFVIVAKYKFVIEL